MNTPMILFPVGFGNVREKLLVDGFGEERGEWCKSPTESEQDLEKCIQGMKSIIDAVFSLQPLPIEPDVPICGIVNELKQPGDDSVKAVT